MNDPDSKTSKRRSTRHARITAFLQVILIGSIVLSALQGQWLAAVATVGIVLLTLVPAVLGRRFRIYIPPEFELLAILFIFGSLFLGEVRGYYTRFWWWDAVLHLGSGFLLGILGFMLVYAVNQKDLGNLGLKPSFVAVFAFSFAVALGALWEIFEFAMDWTFGLNMQKTGLVDTMADLIVDTIGAAAISLAGYGFLRTAEVDSFLERWIERITADGRDAAGDADAEAAGQPDDAGGPDAAGRRRTRNAARSGPGR